MSTTHAAAAATTTAAAATATGSSAAESRETTDETTRATEILAHAAAIELALVELRGALMEAGADAIIVALSREIDRVRDAVKESASTAAQGRVDEATLQAHLGAMEAEDRLRIVGPFIQRALSSVKATLSRGALEVVERAAEPMRLQLALARMDAADIIDERHERARADLRAAERATAGVLERLRSRIARVGEGIAPAAHE